MVYGVKIRNFLKGWYDVAIFKTRKEAEKCYETLLDLWENTDYCDLDEAEWEWKYNEAFTGNIGYEEEYCSRDLQVLNKGFNYTVNNEGWVSTETSNMRLVYDGSCVAIPA